MCKACISDLADKFEKCRDRLNELEDELDYIDESLIDFNSFAAISADLMKSENHLGIVISRLRVVAEGLVDHE